ncbi:hypothetical protein [Nocardia asteroides]|uniref:hypothetical protein n=1 Tax=Nocardia asteroides TaxID=1824 RepID=UPI001E36A18E|nr:hypothetical protein [Nocardia asteroides]UGT64427.1 hypothetical protein LTT61_14550 [Nocardia asteroides]
MCKNIHDKADQNWKHDHNWIIANTLVDKVLAARDGFFKYVSTFDGSVYPDGGPIIHRGEGERPAIHSLWTFFDYWAWSVREDLAHERHLWLDPRINTDAIWEQFVRLLPTIYLMICEAYDQDPSKIDLIQRDPASGRETRTERRVKTKLPCGVDLVESHAFGHAQPDPEASTDEGFERGVVMFLLTDAEECWPKAVFGADVPGDESTKYI